MPDAKEGEASELLIQALDWSKDHKKDIKEKKFDFKPIKLRYFSFFLNILSSSKLVDFG